MRHVLMLDAAKTQTVLRFADWCCSSGRWVLTYLQYTSVLLGGHTKQLSLLGGA